MTARPHKMKFSRWEIATIRYLLSFGGAVRPIIVHPKFRPPIVKLWRGGLVEVWYRTTPSNLPAPTGPFYALSSYGQAVAVKFVRVKSSPAPRGISGAETST